GASLVIVGPQLRIFRTAIEFHCALQQARTSETMSAPAQFHPMARAHEREHLAQSDRNINGVEDYQVALAPYPAPCERWPGTPVTLRQGARVIEDSRRLRVVSSQ